MLMLILLVSLKTIKGTSKNSRGSGQRTMVRRSIVNLRGKVTKNGQNDNSQTCQRYGCMNHHTSPCCIPKNLVDLYMKYGGKGKQVQGNKAEAHFNTIQDNPQAGSSQSAIQVYKPKDDLILDEDMLVDYTRDVFGDLS